jgi:D-alanine-D-alanine ligase
MKKNIAIVAGGDQSEVIVSLKSAAGIYSFLDKEKFNPYIVTIIGKEWTVEYAGEKITIDKNDFSFTYNNQKIIFDFAYITIHGMPGEDGKLQGYFDMMRIPYSSCGVLAAALTFNKFFCNNYLKVFGIKVAESILFRKGETISAEEVVEKLGLPCFIKPNAGGSSFGVTKVKSMEQIIPAIDNAFTEGNEVIIESFLQGTEVTCGIYKTKNQKVVLPVTEVVSENEFFDFNAKYNGQVQEITPARLSEELTKKVQQLTSSIYDIIDAKGIIRVDYIITGSEAIYLLEVNTVPGMTKTSFIPQQVKAAGLNITEVMTEVISLSLTSTTRGESVKHEDHFNS